MLEKPTFTDVVGAVLSLVALGVVGYMAIVQHSEVAGGAAIALLASGAGWMFRARLAVPADPIDTAAVRPAAPTVPPLAADPTLTREGMPPPP